MKTIPTKDALGMILAHDMTQIIPGEFKGRRFKKGHIVQKEDISVLLDMGKEQLFVLDLGENIVHEDDAAIRMAKASAGQNINYSEPKEGKVEFSSKIRGILTIDRDSLMKINDNDEVMFACLHSGQIVEEGQVLGGTRVIPLAVKDEVVSYVEDICKDHTLIQVKPLKSMKVAIVTTGSEIYHGRIKDSFGPVLRDKFNDLGSEVFKQSFAPDDEDMIVAAIHEMIEEGAELIAVTGGMSVDPDDRTPSAIRKAGTEILTYGAPALPGAMFLLGYLNDIPIVGLPGCVMYHKISIFDLIVPRILAGERPSRSEIKMLGHGGFCRNCPECHYPNCSFGKY